MRAEVEAGRGADAGTQVLREVMTVPLKCIPESLLREAQRDQKHLAAQVLIDASPTPEEVEMSAIADDKYRSASSSEYTPKLFAPAMAR